MEQIEVIKNKIKDAFGDVPFPVHLGMHAAIAMDDWVSEPKELIKITEEKDVKGKWWEIPTSEFKDMSLASCYFDAKATEFYLPAYMSIVLDDTIYPKYSCLISWLKPGVNDEECALYDYFKEQFRCITGEKKDICIVVIEYIRDHLDPKDHGSEEDIREILSHEYWKKC